MKRQKNFLAVMRQIDINCRVDDAYSKGSGIDGSYVSNLLGRHAR